MSKGMSRKNNKRKNSKRTNTFFSGIISLLLIIMCSCFFGSFFSSAHDDHSLESVPRIKYYKSVEIQEGDSLWKIAEEHISEEYDSVYEYIDELIRINQIDVCRSNYILEGSYITISYYE